MHPPDSITVLVTRTVRAQSEQNFEDAVKRWIPRFLGFPGQLGVHMLRPLAGNQEYATVLKFCSHREWQAFRESPQYLQFLAEIRPYLDKEPQIETICGLESWFAPQGTETKKVPSQWKMMIVTWIGVCFTVYTVTLLFTPVTGNWPWFLNFITINAGVVVGLTWWVMPLLNLVFRRWLLPLTTH